MGMKHFVALLYLAMVLEQIRGENEDKLLNPSTLEMFVDELPHMPKIKGYEIENGVPVASNLTICNYDTTWVIEVLSISLMNPTFLIFLFCLGFFGSSHTVMYQQLPCQDEECIYCCLLYDYISNKCQQ